jgi:hypothetical protein
VSEPIVVASYFDPHTRVTVDPWGVNPLIEDYEQINAATLTHARAEGPEPTLFESGDLPPFTASGVDPEVLNRLPYTARHAAAAEPSAATVLGMIEQYGNDPTIEFEHQGLGEYRQRVTRWLSGFDKPKVEMTSEESDQLMSELFDE